MKIERNQISHESAAEQNDWSIDVFQSINCSDLIFLKSCCFCCIFLPNLLPCFPLQSMQC